MRKVPAGKFSQPMIDAVHKTVPKDMEPSDWADMQISAKLRKVVRDWLKTNGCDFEEPVYKPTGRPKGSRTATKSK